jgi:K+-transporting ATPase KdpF subunit
VADLVSVGLIIASFALLIVLIRGGRPAVKAGDVVGIVLSIALVAYLIAALLFPERF